MRLLHTLKAWANGEFVDSNCCWAALVCSTIPFWNVASTWSNMALQDISNAGITEASKLDFNDSCTIDLMDHTINSEFLLRVEVIKSKSQVETISIHEIGKTVCSSTQKIESKYREQNKTWGTKMSRCINFFCWSWVKSSYVFFFLENTKQQK